MTHFDDFLGLGERDFSRSRLNVFYGPSGSGKSTAISFLVENHFRHRPVMFIQGPPFSDAAFSDIGRGAVVVIDEIASLGEFFRLFGLLRSKATLLVATHVNPLLFRLAAPSGVTVFHTGRDRSKIARHLEREGVSASGAAIDQYVRRFGATYTDADLIMERCPSRSFDRSLSRFLKLDRIELARPRRG